MFIAGTLREVNIKEDLPTVDDAIKRIAWLINNVGSSGVTAIKIIHGYGSSGKGGGIRTEARRYLARQKSKGKIKDFIPGEDFSIFNESTIKAFKVCGELRSDPDLERYNNGMTIIVL